MIEIVEIFIEFFFLLYTHNQARSQMAEAFLKKYVVDHFNVYSEGFKKRKIPPMTIQIMEEKGLGCTGKSRTQLLLKEPKNKKWKSFAKYGMLLKKKVTLF